MIRIFLFSISIYLKRDIIRKNDISYNVCVLNTVCFEIFACNQASLELENCF